MVNFKPIVFGALRDLATHVADQYPQDDWDFPVIIYADEANEPDTYTSQGERLTLLRFRVEIHTGNAKTTDLMQDVNDRMSALGLRRTTNMETSDPVGRKIRTMRFEGLYDNQTQRVYHTR